MVSSSIEEAIGAMAQMDKDEPYGLKPEDAKRRLIYVEGEKTSPHSAETFPAPADLRSVPVRPIPVPDLSELIALKVMSGRARDDADVVELLKRHRKRMGVLRTAAARRLKTAEARQRLDGLLARAREELTRRR